MSEELGVGLWEADHDQVKDVSQLRISARSNKRKRNDTTQR